MVEQNNIFNNRTIIVSLRDEADKSVFAEIFRWREYRAVEDIVKKSSLIVDVGAHAGFFTLYCAALNPSAKILSLEPDQENFLLLKKHIKENHLKFAQALNVALAKESGTRKLLISADNHNHRLTANDDDQEKTATVSAINLKDLCQRHKIDTIDVLKIDIEGGEYEIIENLDAAVIPKIRNIILEYHNIDNEKNRFLIENILRKSGFGIQHFPSKFDKKMGFILANNKRI